MSFIIRHKVHISFSGFSFILLYRFILSNKNAFGKWVPIILVAFNTIV